MHVVETETRKGFVSSAKRIWEKHYKESYPVLAVIRDSNADTMEYIAFKSEDDYAEWKGRRVDRVIYSQHVGAWEGYGEGRGKGLVYHP